VNVHHSQDGAPAGWFLADDPPHSTAASSGLRGGYLKILTIAAAPAGASCLFVAVLILGLGATMLLFRWGGTSSPLIDGGQIQLHVRAPRRDPHRNHRKVCFQAVEDKIREVIPDKERSLFVDNIGPASTSLQSGFRRWLDDRDQTMA